MDCHSREMWAEVRHGWPLICCKSLVLLKWKCGPTCVIDVPMRPPSSALCMTSRVRGNFKFSLRLCMTLSCAVVCVKEDSRLLGEQVTS